jgi:tRNA pseudouridine13 synthase
VLPDWPFAHGGPAGQARLRAVAEDFQVDELMEVPAHAGGAHWWLHIAKRGMNTKDVALALCAAGSARIRQVGYAGLKDKHALTRQWFSVPLETLVPEQLPGALPEACELLGVERARKAIRRGGLRGNRFALRLRGFSGRRTLLEQRLLAVAGGVPNYFGEQRFGIDGNNLLRGRLLLGGQLSRVPRHERGLYLSAVRAYLFNLVLAERVERGSWNGLLPGEAVNLAGSRSCFNVDQNGGVADEQLQARLAAFDIHPSGPLAGAGASMSSGACLRLEQQLLGTERVLVEGLAGLGMRAERRALRLVPQGLEHGWQGDDLLLSFSLPAGAFATTVLRELVTAA